MKSAIFLVLLCASSHQSLALEAAGGSVVRSAVVDKSGHVEVPAVTEAPPADAPAADASAADAPADAATSDLAEEDDASEDSPDDDDDNDEEDGDDDADDAELVQEGQPEEEAGDEDEDASGDEEEEEETDADEEASLIQDPEGGDEDADAGDEDEDDADDEEESFFQARQARRQHIREWVQKQQAKCTGEVQAKVCSAACGEKFKTTDNKFCSALRTLAKSNEFNQKTKRWSMSQHRIKCSDFLSKQPECTSEAGLCQGRMTHFLRATFKRSQKVAGTDRNWERRSSDKAKAAAAAHLPGCAATWL